jgi:hypothetical protein
MFKKPESNNVDVNLTQEQKAKKLEMLRKGAVIIPDVIQPRFNPYNREEYLNFEPRKQCGPSLCVMGGGVKQAF